jgi:hypothetical protein
MNGSDPLGFLRGFLNTAVLVGMVVDVVVLTLVVVVLADVVDVVGVTFVVVVGVVDD